MVQHHRGREVKDWVGEVDLAAGEFVRKKRVDAVNLV